MLAKPLEQSEGLLSLSTSTCSFKLLWLQQQR